MEVRGQSSFAELLGKAIDRVQEIFRSEVRLAKAEVREALAKAGKGAVLCAIGLLLGFYATALLLTAGVVGLAMVLPVWLAALVLGIVLAIGAAVLLALGVALLKKADPVPHQAIGSVKENLEWAKGRT